MVDKRTDIWAFGCVLFEMLTGRSPFARDTITDTLAAVVDREPDWNALPASTPSTVRRLLRRCVDKDPQRRLHDIADARVEVEDILSGSLSSAEATEGTRARVRPYGPWVAVVATALIAFALGWTVPRRPALPVGPSYSRVVRLTSGVANEIGPAISPDGKWVAYLSNARGPTDVWVKFIAGGDPVNLTAATNLEVQDGTGTGGLVVSPDGTRVAVQARERARSPGSFETWELPAPLPGVPRKLVAGNGLTWSPDGGQLTFGVSGGLPGDALFVAAADGTNPREIIKAQDGTSIGRPGPLTVIFTSLAASTRR